MLIRSYGDIDTLYRYTVSPTKPSDFQPSHIDAQKLKRMVELLGERIKAIKNVTPIIDVDGESSGSSASGSKCSD